MDSAAHTTSWPDITRWRRNFAMLGVAVSPLAAGCIAAGIAKTASSTSVTTAALVAGIPLFIVGLGTSYAALAANPRPVKVRGILKVEANGDVRFDGRRLVSTRSLCAGFVSRGLNGWDIVLDRAIGPSIRLSASTEATALSIVHALALDVRQRAVALSFVSRVKVMVPDSVLHGIHYAYGVLLPALATGLAVWLGTDKGLMIAVAAVVGTLLLVGFLIVLWTPTRVRVGADGLLVSWLGRSTFHSSSQIASVEGIAVGRRLGLAVRPLRGKEEKLLFEQRLTATQNLATQQRLLALFRRALVEPMTPPLALGLAPRQTDEIAWIGAIRAKFAEHASRDPAGARAAMWAAVEYPRGDAQERAAIAAVLADAMGESDRERFLQLARGTAKRALRSLFLALGSGRSTRSTVW